MNVPLYIAKRLGLKPSESHRRSPGVWVGYLGVALAIFIMLTSIFVVNGFKKEITAKLSGFNADITILAPENVDNPAFTSGLRLTDTIKDIVGKYVNSADLTLSIHQPAIIKTDDNFQGVILKGLSGNTANWAFYSENLVSGQIPNPSVDKNSVLISSFMSSRLKLNVGDIITVHFLDGNSVKTRKLSVSGIFDTHFQDFDSNYALTPIEMLQQLNHIDSITGTALEVRGVNFGQINDVALKINNELISSTVENPDNPILYKVSTIHDSCGQYLSWLDLLDTNVATIIVLMAFVAGFTLISSLFIIILERVNTIGLLKALGATNAQIRKTFIYMAERLVLTGLIFGNIIAIIFAIVQDKFHLLPLDAEAYYLDYVPMDFSVSTLIIVNIVAIVISSVVLILPSHLIAKLSPASSLRFE